MLFDFSSVIIIQRQRNSTKAMTTIERINMTIINLKILNSRRKSIVGACTWQWLDVAAVWAFISAGRREILLLWCLCLKAYNLYVLAVPGTFCPHGGQGVWVYIHLSGCLPPILLGIMLCVSFTEGPMMVNCPSCPHTAGLLCTQCCWTRTCLCLPVGPILLVHTDTVCCMSSTASPMREGPLVLLQVVPTTSGAGSSCRCIVLSRMVMECWYLVCGSICSNIYYCLNVMFYFSLLWGQIFFCDQLHQFCINRYAIFVFHIHSLRMNPDHYLRAPRLPRFPVVETFEDMPALYLVYYNEPPLPYATPTSGIVV